MLKGMSKLLGLGLMIGALAGCPKANESRDKRLEDIIINVGESYYIPGYRNFLYCGMNNEKTFSISFEGTFAVNFFYPISIKEFTLEGYSYKLNEVTPEKINLSCLGKKK
jgi:hypothetical protein